MPFASRDRAGQDALQGAVLADNRHLGAFHPQGDALSGQVEADVDLRARPTRPDALTMRSISMAVPVPVGRGDGPAGRAPSAHRRASSVTPSLHGKVLSRAPFSTTCKVASSTQIVTVRPASAGPSQTCWPPIHKCRVTLSPGSFMIIRRIGRYMLFSPVVAP